MAELPGFDMSVINYVKILSLEDQRKSSASKFITISIEVSAISNDGLIDVDDCKIYNACFFISVYHGLQSKGVYKIYDIILNPLNLFLLSGYGEAGSVVDTNNDYHKQMIKDLCDILKCKIIFYIGNKISHGKWKINPDVLTIPYGEGEVIIRIVNDGTHFEYINEDDSTFIYTPKTMNKEKAEILQSKILSSLH